MHDEQRKVSAAHAAIPNGPATTYVLRDFAETLGACLDLTEQDPQQR